MQPGDILYSNVCTSPLCLMVRRGDGLFYDFVAGDFAAPTTIFDPHRFALAMARDPVFPTLWSATVPAAVAEDPAAVLIEAIAMGVSGRPVPTQTFWIGPGSSGVPLSVARGATITFTG